MSLNGPQRRALQEALLSAFPSQGALAQMVGFGLDENLAAVAGGGNLADTVFNLIGWAEARGRTADLVRAALDANSGNRALQALAGLARASATTSAPAPPVAPPDPARAEIDPRAVRRALVDYFSLAELRTLCVDLGVDYDILGGEGKESKARELVAYLQRRGGLDRLVAAIREERGAIV